MASFGLSFMPGAQSGDDERQGAPINQVQQAIKLLSFRLPRVLGGSALAPAPLLQGHGAQGSPFARSAVIHTQQAQPATAPMLPSGGASTPVM